MFTKLVYTLDTVTYKFNAHFFYTTRIKFAENVTSKSENTKRTNCMFTLEQGVQNVACNRQQECTNKLFMETGILTNICHNICRNILFLTATASNHSKNIPVPPVLGF